MAFSCLSKFFSHPLHLYCNNNEQLSASSYPWDMSIQLILPYILHVSYIYPPWITFEVISCWETSLIFQAWLRSPSYKPPLNLILLTYACTKYIMNSMWNNTAIFVNEVCLLCSASYSLHLTQNVVHKICSNIYCWMLNRAHLKKWKILNFISKKLFSVFLFQWTNLYDEGKIVKQTDKIVSFWKVVFNVRKSLVNIQSLLGHKRHLFPSCSTQCVE